MSISSVRVNQALSPVLSQLNEKDSLGFRIRATSSIYALKFCLTSFAGSHKDPQSICTRPLARIGQDMRDYSQRLHE